jgi:PAS domain S-box-containing protein
MVGHSRVGLWLIPATMGDAQEVRLAECSPDLERFLGLSRDELHGKAFAELLHPDDQEQDQKLRADLLAGRSDFYEIELRFVHRSGAPIWGHVAVSTIKDSTGRIAYLVYTIVDVTRRKQMELRLTQINETLKAFAHTVSHDLKGPLSGAITACQVLRKLLQQPLTDRSKDSIMELTEVFSASVSRSIDLINELLALAEAGWEGGGPTLVDVAQVIDRVLEDNAAMIKERGVRLELEDGLGQVPMAPAHVYQVFSNLIGNAIQHNSIPTPTVRLARIDEAHEDDVYRFVVRDNGPGIPEDLQDRLFDPFVRGTGGGNGLGLATVKRIVQIYGGTIRAYNDNGACFEFSVRNLVS